MYWFNMSLLHGIAFSICIYMFACVFLKFASTFYNLRFWYLIDNIFILLYLRKNLYKKLIFENLKTHFASKFALSTHFISFEMYSILLPPFRNKLNADLKIRFEIQFNRSMNASFGSTDMYLTGPESTFCPPEEVI